MDAVIMEAAETQALLERARRGDRTAFEGLVAPERSRLLGHIQGLLGRKLRVKVDPEDVLQESLLRALEAIARFEGRNASDFERWLEGIARNVVRNLVRKKGWTTELEIARDVPAPGSSPSHRHRREERFERLSKAVESLSPDYRTVIRLVRIDGLKIQEVAGRMNRSESAVKNLLLRAMKALRDSLGETESFSLPDRRLGGEEESHAG
ncbi:MAG TPA: RNA polymerase sigma factor [Planctomycetota bacterium]|nr:RNA polymerase sigma factor [Planctomycetota bacterium]